MRPLFVFLAILSLSGCDRAQQAALALSSTPAEAQSATLPQEPSLPEPMTDQPSTVRQNSIEWVDLASRRLVASSVAIDGYSGMTPEQRKLAWAVANEVNHCALGRASLMEGAEDLEKEAVFSWAEKQCVRHLINQAILMSGDDRAQEVSVFATLIDPAWAMPVSP